MLIDSQFLQSRNRQQGTSFWRNQIGIMMPNFDDFLFKVLQLFEGVELNNMPFITPFIVYIDLITT